MLKSVAHRKLPGPTTPKSMVTSEVFASGSIPTEVENLFFKVKIDKISGLLATEFTPPDAVEEVTFQNYEPIADLFNWKTELLTFYKNKAEKGETDENLEALNLETKKTSARLTSNRIR